MKYKYINLLLEKGLLIDKNKPLFIHYNSLIQDFVDEVCEHAKKKGIRDIYLDKIDSFNEYEYLKKASLTDISKSDFFSCNIWDYYAKKKASFLILESEISNLYDDIDKEKINLVSKLRRESKPIYREKVLKSEIAWVIAAVPNNYWAKKLFPNSADPLENFWNILSKICFLDKEDPINEWNDLLKRQSIIVKKLNDLNISKLYYHNSLGTNLEIELPNGVLWQSAASEKYLVNIPSYEIFTTPNYKKTNGCVYASKPLSYNNKLINNIYLKFKDGKVIEYDSSTNKEILKGILESDDYSSYLGEVALVNNDSPISNLNILFNTTLLDENASCHLALGAGFIECIKDKDKYTKDELTEMGINPSNNHVDFMIGTSDLEIKALTSKGIITVMKDGNLII